MKNTQKMQKGFLVPIVVVVIAAIVVGASIFFFKKEAAAPAPTDSYSTTTPPGNTNSPNAVLPVDISGVKPASVPSTGNTGSVDTSTWKTYSNSEFNFTFKYPPTWQSRLQTPRDGVTGVQFFTPESFAKVQAGNAGGALDYIVFREWSGDTTEIDGLPGLTTKIGSKPAIDTGWADDTATGAQIRFIRIAAVPPVTIGMSASTVSENTMYAIASSIVFVK